MDHVPAGTCATARRTTCPPRLPSYRNSSWGVSLGRAIQLANESRLIHVRRHLASAHAIAIRRIRPEEWQSYRAFRLQALADSPNAFATTLEQARAWSDQDWQRRFSSPSAEREFPVIAEVEGQFVGMAWVQVDPEKKTAHLFQMWVAPAHRAGGVGRKLLVEAIGWAKSQGAREIVLGVTCGDSPARRLYESLGFKVVGNLEPLRPTSELMVQNMALTLSPHAA